MRILTPVLFSFLFLIPACGDKADASGTNLPDAAKGAVDAGKDMLSKQTPAFEQLKGSLTTLSTTLAGITDGATAEKAKGTLDGLVTSLKTQLGNLGTLGTLSDTLKTQKDALLKTINEKITSLLGNAAIKEKIGPVLEQLQNLLK
jgi:hypothetical protein